VRKSEGKSRERPGFVHVVVVLVYADVFVLVHVNVIVYVLDTVVGAVSRRRLQVARDKGRGKRKGRGRGWWMGSWVVGYLSG
jgi:hypothetical protein